MGLRLGCTIDRQRRLLKSDKPCRAAAGFRETQSVSLHCPLLFQPAQRLTKNLRGSDIRGHHDPVMHPFALAPGLDDSRPAKIGQMPGNLRLPLLQNLHEIADAKLLIAHQVQQAESRVVSQGLKEAFDVKRR